MANQSYTDRILDSLEGAERAHPKPFFTGRVMQRLQNTPIADWGSVRFTWAISVAVVLIALNLILFFTQFHSSEQVNADWTSSTPGWVVDYTENPSISIYDAPEK
ncbi:MAG: hypothetical protein ACKO6Q_00315 [Bacteroidota bacterium]